MKRYKLIIFDLDDTLLDFHKSQEIALEAVLRPFGAQTSFEIVLGDFRRINHEMWAKFERHEMTKDEVVVSRFAELIRLHRLASGSAAKMNEQFLAQLSNLAIFVPGAADVCARLADRTRLGIITNGVAHVQRSRLRKSGLDQYMSFICVSEDCGYAKPRAEIFHYALKTAKLELRPDEVLMVGDRLDSDILGAHNASLKSCWFNRNKTENKTAIQPHYQICRLEELLMLLP